jgi:hypothetical protein
MAAKLVNMNKTTCTQSEMIEGFVKGWIKAFGTKPEKKSIGVLFSQNALETGSTKSMWNFNVGNVKFVPSANPADDDDKSYFMLSNTWEIIGGKKIIFQPPHRATWFRSFDSLEEGIADHLNFLKNTRYKKSWAAVEAGDPDQFARLLKSQGYYTAPVEDYAKAMGYFFKKYMLDTTFENVISKIENTTTIPEIKIQDIEYIIDDDEITKKYEPIVETNKIVVENKWQKFINFVFDLIKKYLKF